ncbi:NAD-P-binding protein [Mycena capillaripes]|nr:NAD-P-binding protein [Mycena capillaripes]KAJ6536978.1 NAD-P-binding protein [Mycena capillaripes]
MVAKKTVLITGCTDGGIGAALAKEFHSKGFHVFATSRRLETMNETSALGIETLALDVTDINAIKKTKEEISAKTGGKLDILVNNAGQSYIGAVSDLDMSAVRNLFELNVFSTMSMVQEFIPLLIASGNGLVINSGSLAGIVNVPFMSGYNASKAAVHAFGDTLRVELAPFKVKVLNLITGTVASNIDRPYTFPDNSLYKSMEDVFHKTRVKSDVEHATPTDTYARTVVAEAIKSQPRGWLWAAKDSTLIWVVHTFLPRPVMGWMAARTFGITQFSPKAHVKDKGV